MTGAREAVTAELLDALSDRTREGRSIIAATTNRPWGIGGSSLGVLLTAPL